MLLSTSPNLEFSILEEFLDLLLAPDKFTFPFLDGLAVILDAFNHKDVAIWWAPLVVLPFGVAQCRTATLKETHQLHIIKVAEALAHNDGVVAAAELVVKHLAVWDQIDIFDATVHLTC